MSQAVEIRGSTATKVNLENALKLNRQMQLQLLMVRDKIEKLLKNVKEIYEANEDVMRNHLLKQRKKGIGMRGAYLKGGTFYLKGNMFFKDFSCRNCPDNPDYKRRRQEGEMFPMDLDLKGRHVWSLNDKKGVVEGIKEQIIEHLKTFGKPAERQTREINSEKLVKLLQMVSSDFRIDWDVISKHNLQHRHSVNSCEAIWNVYLNPSLKRNTWTEKENQRLSEVTKKYNCQNWLAIAGEIGGRSDFQCFVQYQNYVFYMMPEKTGKWTKEDDERLIEIIERNTINGQINWSNVMLHFPQKPRTTLQCRYTYSLNPRINHAPFTPEEDLLLLAAVKEYGTKFSYIPRTLFPNRTTVQLRSRYRNTLVHRHKQKSWTLEDDTNLMDFVSEHGTSSWKQCEAVVMNHSRISCRTRFLVISKFFEKNPDSTLDDMKRKKQKQWNYVNTENWTEKLNELRKNPKAKLVKRRRAFVAKKITSNKSLEDGQVKQEEPPPKPKKKMGRPKKPPVPRIRRKFDRRKKVYIERLRSNGLQMYNCVKYAYDYRLGEDPAATTTPKYRKLPFVRSALCLQERDDQKNHRFDDAVPVSLRTKITKSLKTAKAKQYEIPFGFSLPTSWSTAMAFRGLCIHTARTDLDSVTAPSFDDSNVHINLFRERLRTLFYTTALLSRLHPTMVGLGEPVPIVEPAEEIVPVPESCETTSEESGKRKKTNNETDRATKRPKIVSKSIVDEVLSIKREIES